MVVRDMVSNNHQRKFPESVRFRRQNKSNWRMIDHDLCAAIVTISRSCGEKEDGFRTRMQTNPWREKGWKVGGLVAFPLWLVSCLLVWLVVVAAWMAGLWACLHGQPAVWPPQSIASSYWSAASAGYSSKHFHKWEFLNDRSGFFTQRPVVV